MSTTFTWKWRKTRSGSVVLRRFGPQDEVPGPEYSSLSTLPADTPLTTKVEYHPSWRRYTSVPYCHTALTQRGRKAAKEKYGVTTLLGLVALWGMDEKLAYTLVATDRCGDGNEVLKSLALAVKAEKVETPVLSDLPAVVPLAFTVTVPGAFKQFKALTQADLRMFEVVVADHVATVAPKLLATMTQRIREREVKKAEAELVKAELALAAAQAKLSKAKA